jgi:hypothetical protein
MPVAEYCPRYYKLRQAWEEASRRVLEGSDEQGDKKASQDALEHLQAHAEVCDDCVGALFAAFPETAGKKKIMMDLTEVNHGSNI